MWKAAVQTGKARHKELASEVYQLQTDLDAWQDDHPEEQMDAIGQNLDKLQAKLMDAGLASVADALEIKRFHQCYQGFKGWRHMLRPAWLSLNRECLLWRLTQWWVKGEMLFRES